MTPITDITDITGITGVLTSLNFSGPFIFSMIFVALICVIVPFAMLIYLRTKKGGELRSFVYGLGIYFFISFIALQLFHGLFFRIPGMVNVFTPKNHPIYYGFYFAFVTALFGVLANFAGLTYAMKKAKGKEDYTLYSIGYAGFEMIAYGSSLFMSNVVLVLMIRSMGYETYMKRLNLSADKQAYYEKALRTLSETPAYDNYLTGIHRILIFVVQIAVIFLMMEGIRTGKKALFFGLAFLCQFLCFLPDYLLSAGTIPDTKTMVAWELIPMALTILLVYRKIPKSERSL